MFFRCDDQGRPWVSRPAESLRARWCTTRVPDLMQLWDEVAAEQLVYSVACCPPSPSVSRAVVSIPEPPDLVTHSHGNGCCC